jgi:hypothetical protein
MLACGSSGQGASAAVAPAAKASHDTVTTGTKTHHPFPGSGSKEINDDNPAAGGGSQDSATTSGRSEKQREPTAAGAGHSSSPCALVTRQEAATILGHAINPPVLAPLGPSCIYRVKGSKQTVTLALQSTVFGPLKSRLKKPQHRTVAGRSAYCGSYGETLTIVSLPHGKVLTITAPCAVGFRFAAKALARL